MKLSEFGAGAAVVGNDRSCIDLRYPWQRPFSATGTQAPRSLVHYFGLLMSILHGCIPELIQQILTGGANCNITPEKYTSYLLFKKYRELMDKIQCIGFSLKIHFFAFEISTLVWYTHMPRLD